MADKKVARETGNEVATKVEKVRGGLTLFQDEAELILNMLMIGAHCYGEVLRVAGEYGEYKDDLRLPKSLCPLDPTGVPDTTGDFAAAIRSMYYATHSQIA